MQTLSEIKTLLAERGLRPRKRFGQNFLHDHNLIRKLVHTARERTNTDIILEVGPGTGALTEALIETFREERTHPAAIIACEIDRDLAALLRERLDDSITLLECDCITSKRELNPELVQAIAGRPFALVANLPYNIASPLIAGLLIDHANCAGMFITIQKEVADRLVAKPSTKAYGPLTIIVQAFARVERIATVPATCFWPRPEVTSAMLAITPRAHEEDGAHAHQEMSDAPPDDARAFARFVTQLFSKRRKQLGSILGRHSPLPDGVHPDQRPEELTIEQTWALFRTTRH